MLYDTCTTTVLISYQAHVMLTSDIRVITLLAGPWNAHLCYTSHYSRSRNMECSPLVYESFISQRDHGMLTSALLIITLLAAA
jgi:hypothetical protein